jgi:hypothetical protein
MEKVLIREVRCTATFAENDYRNQVFAGVPDSKSGFTGAAGAALPRNIPPFRRDRSNR